MFEKWDLMFARDLKCLMGREGISSGDSEREGALQHNFAAAILMVQSCTVEMDYGTKCVSSKNAI